MSAGLDDRQATPGAVQAMLGLERPMATARIEKPLYELGETNRWNRIAVALSVPPEVDRSTKAPA